MKTISRIAPILFVLTLLVSCQQSEIISVEEDMDQAVMAKTQDDIKNTFTTADEAEPVLTTADLDVVFGTSYLTAGQNMTAGTITTGIWTDQKTHEHFVTVIVDLTGTNYVAGTTHIYLGGSGAGITDIGAGTGNDGSGNWDLGAVGVPINNAGNPSIGLFPYGSGNIDINTILGDMNAGTHSRIASYSFPLTSLMSLPTGETCFVSLVHAEVYEIGGTPNNAADPLTVLNDETSWADGIPVTNNAVGGNGGSWAMFNEYCMGVYQTP